MPAIALNLSTGPVINTCGGALLLILAGLVLSVRPMRGRNVFLAMFCAGLGLWTVIFYILSRDDPFMPFMAPVAALAIAASSAGLVGLALVAPRRLAPSERSLLIAPAIVAALSLAITVWGTAAGIDAWMRATGVPADQKIWEAFLVGSYCLFASAVAGVLLLFALRAGKTKDVHERSQFAFMAAAIVVYMGLVAGIFFMTPLLQARTLAVAISVGVACSTVVWLANSRHADWSHHGRNLALFSLGMVLLGMVAGARLGGFSGAQGAGVYGIARSLAILVFAYAILKHQLLGIDVKVRFAISKSTVAAVFIAVFFIASEAAQQFFGETSGSTYIGIGIAGTLVFAMAPLQRAAERLAAKAVPIAPAQNVPASVASVVPFGSDHEDMYRNAARLALRDRRITREEELQLFRLARGLHLTPDRAHEILVEVERERAPAKVRKGAG